jgi:ABC-2 type transport system ATP-binding protein
VTLAIETEGLVKTFGETRAVDGIDLGVQAGSVFGVLGPNGAGKTTTIRMLATLLQPTAGSARVLGHDIVGEADIVRGLVSLTGQFASVDEELTGRENLILLARLLGFSRGPAGERSAELLEAFGLTEAADRLGQHLLGRHAPAARHRVEHRRHARPPVPGRAHDRPRPPQPQPGVGHRADPGGRGHDRAADHPVPRRGRPARRPHRHHRPRPDHRRGHLGELKASVGTGALHVRLHDPGARAEAERVLAATLGVTIERDTDPAALTARGATPDRIAVGLAELVNAGITVEEFALGQPSLDEVFLSLTGHPAETEDETEEDAA